MADSNIEILKKETLLKLLENSLDSRIFNSLYIRYKDTGEKKDILNDGEYSCAFFVSSVLYIFETIEKPVATVKSLSKQLEQNKLFSEVNTSEIREADVIFWQKITYEDGSENAHVGFAISDTEAVSTDYKSKSIYKHLISARPIDKVYRFNW